jgi:hypothetical protein
VCNRFGEEYLAAYQTFVRVSEPEEDFDGRVDLYKLFVALLLLDVPRTSSRLTIAQSLQHARLCSFLRQHDPP